MQETQNTRLQSLGQEDPLEQDMVTHYNILVWRIPWTEEPGGLQFIGLQRIRHDWNDLAHMHNSLKNKFKIFVPVSHSFLFLYISLFIPPLAPLRVFYEIF